MTGITPGQAAYEARERSLWARHGRKDGDRLPVPWAALTDDQRADEEAAGSAVASHLAAAFEAARAREGHSPAPDGEDYVTIRVRVPDHVDVDQVDEIERAAQEWVRDQFPAEADTEDIELPDDRDGEYDDHRGELEASSARPADDVTRAYNLGTESAGHECVQGLCNDHAGPAYKVDDRVLITGKGHPWKGHTGTISGPFKSALAPDLKWLVALDDGWSTAAVAEQDIRRVP